MTAAGEVIGRRYRVERYDRAVGGLRRCRATDTQLDRPVYLWMSEQPGAEEDALLEVARALGRAPHASFLRVLDVAYEDDRIAIVLESIGDSLAAAPSLVPIGAASARALLNAIDRTADDEGLTPARGAPEDVTVDAGAVTADAIAIFLPPATSERVSAPEDVRAGLVALLIVHAADGAMLARELHGPRGGPDDAQGDARARVRGAAAVTTGVGSAIPPAPYRDDEPTLVFTRAPGAAHAAAAAMPAPPPSQRSAPPVAQTPGPPAALAAPAAPGTARVRPPSPRPTSIPAPARRRGAMPWRLFVPLYATLAVVVAGALVFAARGPGSPPGAATPAANQPAGPPVAAPAAGRVTVGLFAREDSGVRVTVDGVVQFDGILSAGQRQAWDGKQRIDVWTDKGKTLGLAVNGRDLGAYSPAMGHADWNRIDFSFWPGWGQ